MNYELIKRLKDEGFPIQTINTTQELNQAMELRVKYGFSVCLGKEIFIAPNIQELLAECNAGWLHMERKHDMVKDMDIWVVKSHDDKGRALTSVEPILEVAIAKVWIAQHNK